MELSRNDFRVMMFYDFKRKLTYQQSHENLVDAFSDSAPSLSTVSYWFREFKRGRCSLEDDPRPGKPAVAVTTENIMAAEKLVRENRNITHREIQQELGIGSSATDIILHQHLGVRKLVSRWVPHLLTESQKQARVDWCKFMLQKFDRGSSKQVSYIITGDESWIYSYDPETKQQSRAWVFENEELPTKVTRGKSANKKMIAAFFRRGGPVAAIPLEDRKTVTAEWYTEVCLPQVFAKLSGERPNTGLRGIMLHHDNATSHTAAKTLNFLHEFGVQLVSHPPYSPDLAPNDFFLFPKIKKCMRGKRFPDPNAAVAEFTRIFEAIPKSEFSACFENWFHRMNKCISAKGAYFEKQ